MSLMSSDTVTILFLVGDIFLLFLAWKRGIIPLRRIQQSVDTVCEHLQSIPAEAYVQRFEDVDKIFLAADDLAPVWSEYRKTLVRSVEDGEEHLFSAIDASAFFRPNEITKSAHVSYWQNFGGVFTGVGIFGTFAGLTLGIMGIDLSSGDVTVLKDGIGALLRGISTAFITSLAGIFLALLYGAAYPYFNSRAGRSIATLSALVEKMYPRRITEQWLSDGFHESKEQTRTLKNLSQDMAESLGQILDTQLSNGFDEFCENLDHQLRPTLEKLYEAIAGLKEGGTAAIANEFDRQVGTQLAAFGNVLTEMQTTIQNSVQASQQVSENINGRMKQTMEGLQAFVTKGTAEAVEKQKTSAEQMSKEIRMLMDALNQSSQQAMDHYAAVSQNAQEQLAGVADRTRETAEGIVAQFQDLAKTQETHWQAVSSSQETWMQNVMTSQEHRLQDMANVQEQQLQSMAEKQQDRWAAAAEQQQTMLQAMADKQAEMMEASRAAAKQHVDETTRLLHETIEQQNHAFEFASEALKKEAAHVAELLGKLREASSVMNEAAVPVQEASASLREEIQSIRSESQKVRDEIRHHIDQMTRNNQISEKQMQELMQAMKNASDASDTAWKTYQSNFEGVSGELERTTALLTEQLAKYNEAMKLGLTSQLKAFDTSISNATGALGGIADELHETMEDLMKYKKH